MNQKIVKIQTAIAALFIANLGFYVYPDFLAYATYLNIAIFSIIFLLIKSDIILLLPFYIYSPIQLHSEYPFFTSTLFLYLLATRFEGRKILIFDKSMLLYFLLIFSVIFSLIKSDDYSSSLHYLAPYLKIFFVILISIQLQKNKETSLLFIKSFSIAGGLAIFYKFFYAQNFSKINSLANLNDELVSEKSSIYISGDFVDRLIFAGQEPNYASAEHLIALAAGLFLINYPGTSSRIKLISVFSVISSYVQIIGSFSRTGFLISTLILTFSLRFNIKSAFIILFTIALSAIYASNNSGLIDRIASITEDKTGSNRTSLWENAINLWIENGIFFGSGFGDYYSKFGDAAHSTYLQILSEQGLFGLTAFVIFIVSTSKITKHEFNKKTSSLYLVFSGYLIFIQTLTFQSIDVLVLFMTTIGLMFKIIISNDNHSNPNASNHEPIR